MSGLVDTSPQYRWLATLCDGSEESVLLVAEDGAILAAHVSATTAEALGRSVGELVDEPPFGLVHPGERRRLAETFRALLADPEQRAERVTKLRHRAGRYVPILLAGRNGLADPSLGAIVVRAKIPPTSEIQDPVSFGGMVGGGERAELLERVRGGIERVEQDSEYGFTVLIVELERMKLMVGNLGQETVDQLVLKVGARLTRLLRDGDLLARLGGGEYAVFLDGVHDRRRAAKIADRMQRTVENRFDVNEQVVRCSATVGIATSERTYTDPEHVMRDASLALNRARVRGRRRRAVFQTQMRVEDARFMALVAELHSSVAKSQLAVHYQPIVSLNDGHLVGFEALLRWSHPSFGMVSPAQFIPIAEETGLITDIGRWVMAEACGQMARWTKQTGADLYVSVNVSAKQLVEDLPGQVTDALDGSGLDAARLALELTESAVLDNREQAVAALSKVKERGVRLSLDDFGTGYSSFSYLHQLPYDTLKIDRSFVARLGAEGDASDDIVHAIIVLAHNLKMAVVAEGVEERAQLEQLRAMFCGFAQGFHFARPLDADQATALITSSPRWT